MLVTAPLETASDVHRKLLQVTKTKEHDQPRGANHFKDQPKPARPSTSRNLNKFTKASRRQG